MGHYRNSYLQQNELRRSERATTPNARLRNTTPRDTSTKGQWALGLRPGVPSLPPCYTAATDDDVEPTTTECAHALGEHVLLFGISAAPATATPVDALGAANGSDNECDVTGDAEGAGDLD